MVTFTKDLLPGVQAVYGRFHLSASVRGKVGNSMDERADPNDYDLPVKMKLEQHQKSVFQGYEERSGRTAGL